MTNLTIAMPSNRDVLESATSIQSTLNYVNLRNDTEFCLHDNSGDRSKAEKYKSLVNKSFSYIDASGFGVVQNWLGAINSGNGDYLNMIGDDDYLFSVGSPVKYEINKELAGYVPNFLVWNNEDGVTEKRNFGITGTTASDRIKEWFKNANGINVAVYCAIKKNLLSEIWSLGINSHPIKAPYWDWAVGCALVSSGKLHQDKSSIFVYNNQNWRTIKKTTSLVKKMFDSAAINNRAPLFILLLHAIDSFILIARATSPVERNEIIQAAQFAFATYCSSFIDSFRKDKSFFLPREVATIEMIDTNSGGFQGLLNWALNVIESFEPGIVDGYKEFYSASIEKHWGYY